MSEQNRDKSQMEPLDRQKRPLKAGVVGMGKMGLIRVHHIQHNPDFQLAAVCDADPEKELAYLNVPVFSDYRELIDKMDLDVVFACAYNNANAEITTRALKRGKHVFCEKPPGRNVDDVKRIIEAEKENPNLKVMFGFNHRRHYAILEAKSMVDSAMYGKILWMRGVYGKCGSTDFERAWRSNKDVAGGGILLDQGIHMLDLFRFFCGDFPEVKSVVTTSHWHIPVEDNAFVILTNQQRQTAIFHSSATQWRHRFLFEICLEFGYIEIRGLLTSTRSYGDEYITFARKQMEDNTRAFGRPREETIYFDQDDSWRMELEYFADSVLNDKKIDSCNSRDALEVMLLIEKIYRDGGLYQ